MVTAGPPLCGSMRIWSMRQIGQHRHDRGNRVEVVEEHVQIGLVRIDEDEVDAGDLRLAGREQQPETIRRAHGVTSRFR